MKRKLLLTFAILPAFSFLGFSQKNVFLPVSNHNLTGKISNSHLGMEKAITCVDTLRYTQAKEQILGSENFYSGFQVWQSDNEKISQAFLNSESITITGVEFYSARNTSSTASVTVQAAIYNVNASFVPTTLISSGSVTFTETTYGYRYVTFASPVTVTGNYAIVLNATNAGGIFELYVNDIEPGQSYDETFSHFYSDYEDYPNPSNWNTISEFEEGAFNYEPLISPIVSYAINTTGTLNPSPACLGTEVDFTNTTSNLSLTNRMMSYQAFRAYFTGVADSTYAWDLDLDQNPSTLDVPNLVWSQHTSHTYASVGSYAINQITLTGFWNSCNDFGFHSLQVNPVDDASFSFGTSTVCEGSSNLVPSSIATPGGTFTASPAGLVINASTGEVDVANSAVNTYTITYTTAGTCSSSSTQNLTITSAPDASFEYAQADYCSTETTITPNITGSAGVFSATSGLSINSGTGVIDVAASSPGTYVVTNDIAASGTCPSASESFTITITEAPNSAFSYAGSSYCLNASNPTATVTGTAGTFASTSGLSVNATTGEIDLANSSAGTYDVSNTVAGSGACAASVTTVTIAITEASTANFSYAAAEFCATGSENATVTGTSGVFTASPSGLSIDGSTGAINLASSTAGTYTVTNTVDATATCGAATHSETITINELPSAAVTSTETTITATEAGATYQWVSCSTNTNISGATSQTYTPVVSGSYKVIVTKDGCSATSECVTINVVGIEENNMDYVTVSPNPASDLISVAGLTDGSVTISVLDVNGKLMAKEVTTTGQAEISVSKFESGVYFIAITSDSINGVKKFVKK